MIEIPVQTALIGVAGTIIVALIVGLFAYRTQAKKEPLENSNAVIAITNQYVALFEKHIALSQTRAEQSAEQTHNNATTSATIAALTEANIALVKDRDGMPKMIDQLIEARLKDKRYILVQREALKTLGMAIADQPIEQPDLTISALVPVDLLDKLAIEKAAREAAAPSNESPSDPTVSGEK